MSNPAKIHCVVESLRDFGAGTLLIDLRPDGRVPKFKAGQFLHLTVDDYNPEGGFWPESRVFSIASRSGAALLTVVMSVKGSYTSRIASSLKVGLPLWAKLPFGDFVIDARTAKGSDVVLVAGGTGISPFIPYLEETVEKGSDGRRVRLFYGVRSCRLVLFSQLLEKCRLTGAAAVEIWSEEPPEAEQGELRFRPGRLDPQSVMMRSQDLASPVFFLSGPPAMISRFSMDLETGGITRDRIQIDEWE